MTNDFGLIILPVGGFLRKTRTRVLFLLVILKAQSFALNQQNKVLLIKGYRCLLQPYIKVPAWSEYHVLNIEIHVYLLF